MNNGRIVGGTMWMYFCSCWSIRLQQTCKWMDGQGGRAGWRSASTALFTGKNALQHVRRILVDTYIYNVALPSYCFTPRSSLVMSGSRLRVTMHLRKLLMEFFEEAQKQRNPSAHENMKDPLFGSECTCRNICDTQSIEDSCNGSCMQM